MLAYSDTDIIDEQRDESGLSVQPPAVQGGSLPFAKMAAVTTRSRLIAMTMADLPGATHAVREQMIDPMVQRAATELVEMDDKGHKTDIKLQGRPYEVLEDLMGELGSIGASRFVTAQVLKALEEFSIHEGLSFSKQAKARPLYARIMVTSEKPDDLPDCEKFQYTFLDGVRRMGRDASNRGNLRPTIHGTQSSGSVVPGMSEMFESSKSKGLLLFFASVEGSDQNKFDDVDNNLMALLQAFMGDAGAASIEEIEGMIRDGKLSPEAAELLKTLAEYQHLRIEAATPGAVDHAEERLAEIKSEIEALLEQDVDLPESVLEAIETQFEAASALVEAALPELQEAAAEITQDNEADAPDLEAAEELLSLIEMLSEKLEAGELEELPPEIQQLLETIGDIETLIEAQGRDAVIAQISEVLAAPSADSDIAKAVQTIVLALNDPAVQIALPQEALNQTNIFLKANADVVETVVRQVLIQDLKASLPDLESEPEAAKLIDAIVDKLQEGQKLNAADVEVIAKVKEQVQGPVSETLAAALKVAQDSITPNVVLSTETLNKITDIKTDLTAVQEALVAMKADGQELSPEQQKLADKIKEVVEVLDRDPANIQALQELSSLNKVLAAPENKALLPASVAAVVERVTQSVENVGAVHETALSIKHDVSVQNIRETVKLIETLVTSKEVLGAADIKIDKVIEELNKNVGSVSAAAELTKIQTAIDKAPPEVAKVLKAQLETVVAAQIESVSKTTGLTTETVRSTLETITALESASPAVHEALKQADVSIAEVVTALKNDVAGVEGLKAMMKLETAVSSLPADAKAALPQELGNRIETVLSNQIERVAKDLGVPAQTVQSSVAFVLAVESNKEMSQMLKAANIDVAKIAANPASTAALVESAKIQAVIDKAPPEMAKVLKMQLETVVAAQVTAVAEKTGLTTQAVRSTLDTITVLQSASPAVHEALKQADVSVTEVVRALKNDLAGVEGLKAMTKLEAAVSNLPAAAKAEISQKIGKDIDTALSAQTERVAEKLGVPVQTVQNSIALVVAVEANKEFAQVLKAADIDVARIAANPASTAALVESAKLQAVIEKAPPEMATVLKAQLQTVVTAQVEAVAQKTGLATEAVRSTMAAVTALESAPPAVREALKEANVNVADVVKALKNDIAGVDGLKAMMKLETAVAGLPADAKAALSQQMGKNIETVVAAQADRVAEKLGVPVQTVQNSIALVVAVETNKEFAQVLKAADIDVARIAANPASTAALVESTKLQALIEKASPEVATVLKAQVQTVVAAQLTAVSEKTGLTTETVRSTVTAVAALESASPAVREALKEANVNVADVVRALKNDPAGVEGLKAMTKLEAVVAALPADAKPAFGKDLDKVVAEQVARIAEVQGVPVQTVQTSIALVVAVEANKEFAQILKAADIDIAKIAANPASTAALVESTKLQALIEKAPPEMAKVLKTQLETVVAAQLTAVSEKTGLTTETVRATVTAVAALENASPAVREALKQADVSVTEVVRDIAGVQGLKAMTKLEAAVSHLPADIKTALGKEVEKIVAAQVARIAEVQGVSAQTVQSSIALMLAAENNKPVAQILKAADVDVHKIIENPAAVVAALTKIQSTIENSPPDVASVMKAQLAAAGLTPNSSENVIYARNLFRNDFANAGGEAENAKLMTAALLQRLTVAHPSAPVVGTPANDVPKHVHDVFKKSTEIGLKNPISVMPPAEINKDVGKEVSYKPAEVHVKPASPQESANKTACDLCTTKDCNNCGNAAAKRALGDSMQALAAERKESLAAQPKDDRQYNPIPTHAPTVNPQESANKTACDLCTTKDCNNCGNAAAKRALGDSMQALAAERRESLAAQPKDDRQYNPIPTYAPTVNPQEAANKTACDLCTTKDCNNCGNAAAKRALGDSMQALQDKYIAQSTSARAESTMLAEEVRNKSACDACAHKDCDNCPTAAKLGDMKVSLASLRDRPEYGMAG